MKPYKYIHIDLHIPVEQHQDGRVSARIVDQLPIINVDTGIRTFANHQADKDYARKGEDVIIVED